MNKLATVQEVIDWLKNFNPDSYVYVDIVNPDGTMSFRQLVKDTSPIDDPRNPVLRLTSFE